MEYVSQGEIREKFEDNGSSLVVEFKELFKKIGLDNYIKLLAILLYLHKV